MFNSPADRAVRHALTRAISQEAKEIREERLESQAAPAIQILAPSYQISALQNQLNSSY